MRLEEGRIRLYLADIRPLYKEKTWRYVYAHMDGERRQKADACKVPQARAASLAAGFLAQYALTQNGYMGCSVCYGLNGQPQVRKKHERDGKDNPVDSPVYISLSHSGDYAVCALADIPVGVDIQKRGPVRAGVLRHFFGDEEREAFERHYALPDCSSEEKKPVFLPDMAAEEFLRLWTAKESFMKVTGEGMKMGFANLTADLLNGVIREREGLRRGGMVREYKAPEGYYLTACVSIVRKEEQKNGIVPLGNWHSHPETPSRPSKEDKRMAYDSNASYLILSLQNREIPVLNSFHIEGESAQKEELKVWST